MAFDPTVSHETIINTYSQKFSGFKLEESEAWIAVFLHECCHSDGEMSEWACDWYAKKRILQLREERETESRRDVEYFGNLIRTAIREGMRERLR